MKSALFLSVLMVVTGNAFAQAQTATPTQGPVLGAKFQICSTYFEADQKGKSNEAQVDQIVSIYNALFELNYDATQAGKLKAKFLENLQLNPKKIEEMHNGAYFACITDIKADDIEQARQHFASVVK